MKLSDSVEVLPGVGPKFVGLLKRLRISTVKDLLTYFPRTYNDYSFVIPINDIEPGEVTIHGKIENIKGRYVRRGLHVTEAVIADKSGKIKAVWFNQPYLPKSLPKNTDMFFSGRYELVGIGLSMQNPVWEKVSEFPKNTARVVPVYKETKGLSSKQLRVFIASCLEKVKTLEELVPKSSFFEISRAEVIQQLHFPDSAEKIQQAKRYMAYEELFTLIAASQLAKREHQSLLAPEISFDEKLAKSFVNSLPFKLTDGQRAASWQIIKDIQKKSPANRLLEGDVGSGKTVVAAMTALQVIKAGYQAAIIAPTEILARQHAENLSKLLSDFDVNVALLVGGIKNKPKQSTLEQVKSGKAQLIVGTHALLEPSVEFSNLGFVVVDEQHRFGVKQREKLQTKSKHMPHLLSMTATPIPRSLALTVYGELDVSVINELPKGRKPIKTKIIRQSTRDKTYQHIDEEISAGKQVYVVCPLIEESDVLGVKSVEQEHKRLQETIFKHRKIGLLHGRMKSADKEKIMQDFMDKKYNILISTTVVEVGVDVANVTVMIIEGAERFGLAQLHQLRGRVGRSDAQSYCYLMPTSDNNISKRLQAMERTVNGFKLAELDLKLRGPGAVYGTRQHGQLDLRFAQLSDTELISRVQEDVRVFLDNQDISDYPELMKNINTARAVTQLN